MRRCIASLSILLSLILLCIISLVALKSECSWYAGLVEKTAFAISQGETETALSRFDAMEAHWEDFHNIAGLFVDGEKLDAVYERMVSLRPLIASEHPQVSAELEGIRRLIESIYEEEQPLLWHIL